MITLGHSKFGRSTHACFWNILFTLKCIDIFPTFGKSSSPLFSATFIACVPFLLRVYWKTSIEKIKLELSDVDVADIIVKIKMMVLSQCEYKLVEIMIVAWKVNMSTQARFAIKA